MAAIECGEKSIRTRMHEAGQPIAWVVLASGSSDKDLETTPIGVTASLTSSNLSVIELIVDKHMSRRRIVAAMVETADRLTQENGRLPVLVGGVGRLNAAASLAAEESGAPGLVSVDGSLLSIVWGHPKRSTPTLLLSSENAGLTSRIAMRTHSFTLGSQARLVIGSVDTPSAHRHIVEWRRAALSGPPVRRRSSMTARLALPMAVGLGLTASVVTLAGSPVGATQRAGDGVQTQAVATPGKGKLGGVKVAHSQRQGDALSPHATGSLALTDKAGMKWFINTDITFVTTSSASAAISEASYTHKVAASTLNGGTAQETLNDAYDGYNSLFVNVNGVQCTEAGQANCTSYNKTGAAPTMVCNAREAEFPEQSIDGLDVSRIDYVPTDDHFERTLNVVTNPGSAPITTTLTTGNNLGSDSNTKITGTSAGDTTPTDSDEWVTTFQNFVSPAVTTTDPRLGHVLQTTGAAVGANHVFFTNGNDNPRWSYTFTVQPGKTMIVGNFAVADPTIAASEADSARLAALPPTALECMTPTQESELANMGSAPTITTSPINQTASPGKTVSFNAQATAAGLGQTPKVQWQVSSDGGNTYTNLAGATSTTLSFVPTNSDAGNLYRAVFSNGIGSTPSSAASLSLTEGYWLVASDGGIFSYGTGFFGSTGAMTLNKPIVGMSPTADDNGYWLVASDGGIFSYGDAAFFGSTGAMTLNKPIVGIAPTPDGKGYWLVASDGGIFSYGDAAFFGSTGAMTLNKPIVGMAPTPDGKGYWLVASDGGIFSYGDAAFFGSTGAMTLNKPIVGMAPTPDGKGYWLVASDGGIFSYGDAAFFGSTGAMTLNKPIVGMAPTPDGKGYWLVASDGGIFAYGDATFLGSTGGTPLNKPIVGMAADG